MNSKAPAPLSRIEQHMARIMPALPAFEVFELAARYSDEEIEAILAERRRFTDGEAYPLIGALIGDQPKGEPGPLSRDGANIFCTPLFIVCVCWIGPHWAVTASRSGTRQPWPAGTRIFVPT
ncbi:MAG: hypothetical protein WBO09_03445 [Methylocystis silviterrae]|uniref:hypothetical protein n=1 Tax=Methylocystis silviterrae TaxID=2743612 RepID=UPI003C79689C